MNRSSEFIENKALFGCYPRQENVKELEDMGVRYFIDLTCKGEKNIVEYTTQYTYINFPIKDRRIPSKWSDFSVFILQLEEIIQNLRKDELIYIHCKGGHGRAGIVVASLLTYLYKMSPSEALAKTSECHSKRKEMREKWRKMGSPQTRSQKHFITKYFEPLYIYSNNTKYFSSVFNNDANLQVKVPDIGTFPTATKAFLAFKERHKNSTEEKSKWDVIQIEIMYTVLMLKFEQHDNIREHLLNTGLRPIIFKSPDPLWGMINNTGKNMLGELLMKLRKSLYKIRGRNNSGSKST